MKKKKILPTHQVTKGEKDPDHVNVVLALELHELLVQLRTQRGWTITEAAEKIGIPRAYLWQLENDKRKNPRGSMLNKISKGYGISMEELIDSVKIFSGGKQKEVEKAFDRKMERQINQCFDHVISDPQFEYGKNLIGMKNIPDETKIFIIELYEKITGKQYIARKDYLK